MDSMNRFCDDLIEDILYFMSFEDKIKYECVCHQWKRCLFKKQTVLVIDGNENRDSIDSKNFLNQLVVKKEVENISNRVTVLRKNSFESVLKKCPSIKKVAILGCDCDDEVLQIIGDNCPKLEDINCELIGIDAYENHLLDFGHKLGKNLKKFRFDYFTISYQLVKGFLYLCPKLESINCDIFAAIADQRPDFLPKLKSLRVKVRHSDEKFFEILGQKYSKTIKNSLEKLSLYGNSQTLPLALKHISDITSLQSLTIELFSDTSTDGLVPSMLMIAENLRQLKSLTINSMVFISQQFFHTLGKFKYLRKLSVNQNLLFTKSNSNINISDLNECKSLTHLSIMGFNITEHFFDDISLYLPQLKSIEFSLMTDNLITNHLFRMFEAMEELGKFSFKLIINKAKKLNNPSFQSLMSQLITTTDNGCSHLIQTCPKLRIIELKNVFSPMVGTKTLNAIITKAINIKEMKFVLNISGDENILKEYDDLAHPPRNLLINLNTSFTNKGYSTELLPIPLMV